jgi:LAO/AO transport system kinase
VGVGQSETAVHSMTDFFLLLMLAGAGDELQGIKRGIMEMADLIAINKADGNNVEKAQLAKIQYKNAIHLFPRKDSGWEPGVLTCSAALKSGIAEIWDAIEKYRQLTVNNGWFEATRNQQATYWMHETIREQLYRDFYGNHFIKHKIDEFESLVLNDKISSFEAARQLLELYAEMKQFSEVKKNKY